MSHPSFERRAKQWLTGVTTPVVKRHLITARDEAVGAVARVRSKAAPDRLRPTLLIVGAQKAGTTYLHHQLIQHSRIVGPMTKELHFFDSRFGRGLGWYLGHFPRDDHDGTVAMESSPGYLFHPYAAERIASTLPEAKALVLLRDPVKRAYSHFLHERRLGFEPVADFEAALDLEAERIADDLRRLDSDPGHVGFAWRHYSYLARGEYAGQIRRMRETLGSDRVLVRFAEDLFSEPRRVISDVVDFVGLPSWTPGQLAPNDMSATGEAPLSAAAEARVRAHFAPHEATLASELGASAPW